MVTVGAREIQFFEVDHGEQNGKNDGFRQQAEMPLFAFPKI